MGVLKKKINKLHASTHKLKAPKEAPSSAVLKHIKTFERELLPSNIKSLDCVYILNLAKRREKLEAIEENLRGEGLIFNCFEGIDGWDLPSNTLKDLYRVYREFNALFIPKLGEMGCILSSLSIIQDAYNRGYECIWLLQDDVEILSPLNQITDYIEKLKRVAPDWGLLFTDLDARKYNNNHKKPADLLKITSLKGLYNEKHRMQGKRWLLKRKNISSDFQEIRMRYGTYSVLISRCGMKKIIDHFQAEHPLF